MDRPSLIACVAVSLLGVAMQMAGWALCRQPGVPFWTWYAPMWRAYEFLTPKGVFLYLAGLAVMAGGWAPVAAALLYLIIRDGQLP